jgi:type III secretory pathway lipoprotein EscJ
MTGDKSDKCITLNDEMVRRAREIHKCRQQFVIRCQTECTISTTDGKIKASVYINFTTKNPIF